ncbi:hypothetical protein DFH06DRAFT_1126905 [Mycena polygramma]|nr:hypothetical protein DFH06DRAFT_1127336 [Mycena polygramma]KAJ7666856.1 hypothetical protein DFH06DRAFT_1126905 [Mycena polygramma]
MAQDLTPEEIAARLTAEARIPSKELEQLVDQLSIPDLEKVVDAMGLTELARALPPVLLKVLLIYQRKLATKPPEEDDEMDALIRSMDAAEFLRGSHTPPPASPELPPSPAAPRVSRSTPSTPHGPARTPGYEVSSPTKSGHVVSWLEAGSLTQGVRGASAKKSAASRSRARNRPSAYAVFYGGQIGAFTDWADVQASITGNGLAIHCGFPGMPEAEAAVAYARTRGWTADSTAPAHVSSTAVPASYPDNPLTCGADPDVWYAVCRGVVPGVYRSWVECALNTMGIKGNLCSSFPTQSAAEKAFGDVLKAGYTRVLTRSKSL